MLLKLWPGYLYNQSEMINMRVDEDNGGSVEIVKVRALKSWRFSGSEFWKNIGCLISAPNFGLGGLILWGKEEEPTVFFSKE